MKTFSPNPYPFNLSLLKHVLPLLAVVSLNATAGKTSGGPPCDPNDPSPRADWVHEHSPVAGADFIVNLTNNKMEIIESIFLPGGPDGNGGSKASIYIDKSHGACDATNDILLPDDDNGGGGPNGARARLWIETIYYDNQKAEFYLGNNFDAIYAALGANVSVRIPDLFADTNSDEKIGDGDILYSLVDLADYLTAIPSFNFGDSFDVVNGTVAGLKGLYFSTTDFVFSPTAENGFTWTPYSGNATAKADHELVTKVPESSGATLFGLSLITLGLMRKWRARINKR